jgi:hypothetical protein
LASPCSVTERASRREVARATEVGDQRYRRAAVVQSDLHSVHVLWCWLAPLPIPFLARLLEVRGRRGRYLFGRVSEDGVDPAYVVRSQDVRDDDQGKIITITGGNSSATPPPPQ